MCIYRFFLGPDHETLLRLHTFESFSSGVQAGQVKMQKAALDHLINA